MTVPPAAPLRRPAVRLRVVTALLTGAALLAGTGLLAGCSRQDSASSAAGASVAEADAPAAAGATAAGVKGAAGKGAGVKGAGLQTGALLRDVVRTAALTVRVDDLRAAADAARELAEREGGGLEAEDAYEDQDVLRLRVDPQRLDEALAALARLGTERARSLGSEDVTEQVADLDSRLATQRASVERVRALLRRADALSDVVAVEGELAEREADLESLQARVRAVRGRAELATVTLTLQGPRAVVAADAAGFRDGLAGGLGAFLAAGRALLVVLGAVLPFLPLLALALLAGRWYARRTPAA